MAAMEGRSKKDGQAEGAEESYVRVNGEAALFSVQVDGRE